MGCWMFAAELPRRLRVQTHLVEWRPLVRLELFAPEKGKGVYLYSAVSSPPADLLIPDTNSTTHIC